MSREVSMTKIALCFTGQARTVNVVARKHAYLIERFRDEFDTCAIGLTDTHSTYPVNYESSTLGMGHYDIKESLPIEAIEYMNLDIFELTNDVEWNTLIEEFLQDINGVESNDYLSQLLAQFWKYKKITSIIPEYDLYIKLRWDVQYEKASVDQMISNVRCILDKEKHAIPPMAEVFVTGLYIHPHKGLMFQDYSPIYATSKAQMNYNDTIIDIMKHHINSCDKDLSDFSFIDVWTAAFMSSEKNISMYNVPYNRADVDNIIRPDWHEALSISEIWHDIDKDEE